MPHLDAFLSSLEIVAGRCEDIVPTVYDELFKRYPDMRALFVLDVDDGVKGHMLNETLSMAEGLLSDDGVATSFIAAERMNHCGYGIDDLTFDGYYPTLRDVIQNIAGDAWTDDMTMAWDHVIMRARAANLELNA
ncbi:MAG: globin [Pseudomonadota bacterium]